MSKKNIETREQFFERFFFDIFVDCIVVGDSKNFDYSIYKTMKNSYDLPIQISALIQEYATTDGSRLDALQKDNSAFFLLYMNYKHLFRLEYFDDALQQWFLLDSAKLSSFTDKLLCRVMPYINEKLGILKNDDIQFSIVNQYFILSN